MFAKCVAIMGARAGVFLQREAKPCVMTKMYFFLLAVRGVYAVYVDCTVD